MSLYNKVRPKKLEDFVGNKSVISAIRNKLDSDNIPDVILFHGSHGSGKTTLARMIPEYLGVSKNDIKEYDIGAIRGIDTIREIREQSIIKPFSSKYKFYILDEFHAASSDAKTAALKWLEDTPPHVRIIICTTETTKLPGTVKSRCVPFKLEPLSNKEMEKLIMKACKREKVAISGDVIGRIIDLSFGIPRQALVYLESVLGLEEEKALKVLFSVSDESKELKALFSCLLKKSSWADYCHVIKNLKEEPETIRRAVLGYMTAIMLNQINGKKGFLNRLAAILEIFGNNWYDSGRSGLVRSCYEVCCLGE